MSHYHKPLFIADYEWEKISFFAFNHIFRRKIIMAQKVVGLIKLQIPAGKATPAPPVGPALGQHGVKLLLSQRTLTKEQRTM